MYVKPKHFTLPEKYSKKKIVAIWVGVAIEFWGTRWILLGNGRLLNYRLETGVYTKSVLSEKQVGRLGKLVYKV